MKFEIFKVLKNIIYICIYVYFVFNYFCQMEVNLVYIRVSVYGYVFYSWDFIVGGYQERNE